VSLLMSIDAYKNSRKSCGFPQKKRIRAMNRASSPTAGVKSSNFLFGFPK
jgi:hypothetical protein